MSDDFKMDLSAEIEAARKRRVNSFKLNIEEPTNSVEVAEMNEAVEELKPSIKERNSNKSEQNKATDVSVDTSSEMMSDDFSEKYSLHKYTDANQIEDDEDSDEFVFDGEEVAIDGMNTCIEYEPLCGKCYIEKVLKIKM
jgi:hypothetical protein